VQGRALAQHLAALLGQAHGLGKQGADFTHADDVPSGLVVLVLRRAAQALHDLAAGGLKLRSALMHQLLQVVLVGPVLADQPGLFKDLLQCVVENLKIVQRLGDEVPGAQTHGLEGVLHDADT